MGGQRPSDDRSPPHKRSRVNVLPSDDEKQQQSKTRPFSRVEIINRLRQHYSRVLGTHPHSAPVTAEVHRQLPIAQHQLARGQRQGPTVQQPRRTAAAQAAQALYQDIRRAAANEEEERAVRARIEGFVDARLLDVDTIYDALSALDEDVVNTLLPDIDQDSQVMPDITQLQRALMGHRFSQMLDESPLVRQRLSRLSQSQRLRLIRMTQDEFRDYVQAPRWLQTLRGRLLLRALQSAAGIRHQSQQQLQQKEQKQQQLRQQKTQRSVHRQGLDQMQEAARILQQPRQVITHFYGLNEDQLRRYLELPVSSRTRLLQPALIGHLPDLLALSQNDLRTLLLIGQRQQQQQQHQRGNPRVTLEFLLHHLPFLLVLRLVDVTPQRRSALLRLHVNELREVLRLAQLLVISTDEAQRMLQTLSAEERQRLAQHNVTWDDMMEFAQIGSTAQKRQRFFRR